MNEKTNTKKSKRLVSAGVFIAPCGYARQKDIRPQKGTDESAADAFS